MSEILIGKGSHYGFEVTPGCYCALCGPSAGLPLSVSLTVTEPRHKADRADGLARGDAHRKACASCGLVVGFVGEVIPIECRSYDCPECGRRHALEYRITELEIHSYPHSGFTFETEIKCRECSWRRKFASQLDSRVQCDEIRLSPEGIELSIV